MDLTETLLAATEQWLQKTAPNRVATSSVTADGSPEKRGRTGRRRDAIGH